MAERSNQERRSTDDADKRRAFLDRASSLAMSAGLLGGYGLFAYIAGRFLYPARPQRRQWMFVAEVAGLNVGDSLLYRGPSGETINIARQSRQGSADDFIALSSTCPHLGCQVHWEGYNNRFYCPCHNGVFDAAGTGIAGPPGDAGLTLPRYALKIEQKLLYIEVPVESLNASTTRGELIEKAEGIHAPGHDPCLARRSGRDRTA